MKIYMKSGREIDANGFKITMDKDGINLFYVEGVDEEWLPWNRVETIDFENQDRYELEKNYLIDWLRRMSDKHWKKSSDADSESEKYYHRGKAHAYEIVLNTLQDESLRDEYEKSEEE